MPLRIMRPVTYINKLLSAFLDVDVISTRASGVPGHRVSGFGGRYVARHFRGEPFQLLKILSAGFRPTEGYVHA